MNKDISEMKVFDLMATKAINKLINNGEILTRPTHKYGRINGKYERVTFKANCKDYKSERFTFYKNNQEVYTTQYKSKAKDFLKKAFINQL